MGISLEVNERDVSFWLELLTGHLLVLISQGTIKPNGHAPQHRMPIHRHMSIWSAFYLLGVRVVRNNPPAVIGY